MTTLTTPTRERGNGRAYVQVADGTQIYPGYSHGMCSINKDVINQDLFTFISSR